MKGFVQCKPGAVRTTSGLHRVSLGGFSLSEYTYGRVARPMFNASPFTVDRCSPRAELEPKNARSAVAFLTK